MAHGKSLELRAIQPRRRFGRLDEDGEFEELTEEQRRALGPNRAQRRRGAVAMKNGRKVYL